jgi:hypothetical protein
MPALDTTKKSKKERRVEETARHDAELDESARRVFGDIKMPDFPGGLGTGESWWVERYIWLKECGYLLRPRYAPDWVPSWPGTNKDWLDSEDARCLKVCSFVLLEGFNAHVRNILELHHSRCNPYQ